MAALSHRPEPNLSGTAFHTMAAFEALARNATNMPDAKIAHIVKKRPDLFPNPLDKSLGMSHPKPASVSPLNHPTTWNAARTRPGGSRCNSYCTKVPQHHISGSHRSVAACDPFRSGLGIDLGRVFPNQIPSFERHVPAVGRVVS